MHEDAGLRLSIPQTRTLCEAIFQRAGLSAQDAATVADNLVFADLRGISTHGITRVCTYFARAKEGYHNTVPHIKLLRETPGSFLLDGDNGYGAVVGTRAMRLAIEKAKQNGVCLGSVCHSNHFGAASYYTLMAAERDMVGFCCTNSPPNMAPYGSREPMLGTNPFSTAVPAGQYPPMVLDIATSVVARGNILNAAKNGRSIPAGWAIDREGNPTTDAQKALQGAVLPFGGHKGSGIAIIIDVLSGILSGAAFGRGIRQLTPEGMKDGGTGADIGHLFLALDIYAFQDPDEFKARMDRLITELKQAERTPETREILYPGELEQRRMAENLNLGIPVGQGTYQELMALCSSLGLSESLQSCLM